jgi:hypothetical protein
MAGQQPAPGTALALEAATGKKGFGASREARGAQKGNGVGHAPILGGESGDAQSREGARP